MSYDVHLRQLERATVVTERKHTTLARLGNVMHHALAEIASVVDPPGSTEGAPFAIYHNEPFRPDDVDVEMGLRLATGARVAETDSVHCRDMSGGPVAYTLHVGPYATIDAAYRALLGWLGVHGYKPVGPPRELYLVGPSEGVEPARYRTEIEVPVA